MPNLTEVSNDQTDWVLYERGKTRIEDYRYLRNIDTAHKSWSRGQIDVWLLEKRKLSDTHIEYSMDDGFSWQVFRLGRADDSARIFAVLQNKRYLVRSITLIENTNYVQTMSSIQDVINQVNNGTMTNPDQITTALNRAVRIKTEKRWVVQSQDAQAFEFTQYKPDSFLTEIEHRIPMAMDQPNENIVNIKTTSLKWSAAVEGHVYYLEPCTFFPKKWQDVLLNHRKEITNPQDWYWVESARMYDDATMGMSGACFAMTVLSDKYYVDSNRQPKKIGSRWLIQIGDVQRFVNNINAAGGFATTIAARAEQALAEQGVFEVMANIKEQLSRAVESRDPEAIARLMFEGIDARDRAIEEIKDMNKIIQKAREVAIELINGPD